MIKVMLGRTYKKMVDDLAQHKAQRAYDQKKIERLEVIEQKFITLTDRDEKGRFKK